MPQAAWRESIAEEGTVCTYGAMSSANARHPHRRNRLPGRHLHRLHAGKISGAPLPEKIRAIYAELADGIASGTIHAPVDSVYAIENIRDALIRAQTGGRHGKVLVSPGGEVE
ncbi:MAG: zinc-binding dehydrogenase [Parvibaculum sp.]|nr:zinc-binding dehydrogenase [Parvibaculum sp.]